MPKLTRKEARAQLVQTQKAWITEHGLSQAGYSNLYGEPGRGGRGQGGQSGSAIFAADTTSLARKIGLLKKACGRPDPELQSEDVFEAIFFASDAPVKAKLREERRTVKLFEMEIFESR